MNKSERFQARYPVFFGGVGFRHPALALSLLCVSILLLWPSQSEARSVDSVTLTPSLSVAPDAGSSSAAPGGFAPTPFTVSNQGASLSVTGELDFTAPLLNTSVIRGWWMVVERRAGSGSWTPVAGSSAAVAGHTFSAPPPSTSGMTVQASPKYVLGVSYPSTGDRVVGTQIPGLLRANWDFASHIALSASATSALMSAASSGDVRLRWRLESRNTGLFGIVTSGSRAHTAPFKLMLGSQSASASNVNVSITGDGRTQTFSPANTPGLSSIPVGGSVPITSTAKIPAIPARAGNENVADYLARLEAARDQAVSLTAATGFTATGSAVAYWWWPWDTDSLFDVAANRSLTAPDVSRTSNALVPIIELSKVGPASVNSGGTADYEITANNIGNTPGSVTVIDTVDGYVPQPVPGYGSVASGSSIMKTYSHLVSITTPSGTLGNTAAATWTDSAGNSYGPVDDSVISEVIGDEDPPPPPTLTQSPPQFTNSSSATFEFVGELGGAFECSLGSGAATACTSPFNTGALADGLYQFSVSQRDASGNLGSATTYVWTVDTVPPDPATITQAPSGIVPSASASIIFTTESQAGAECQLNSGAWTVCASPVALSNLSDGAVVFAVRQTDLAGNISPLAQTSWTVDTTAPAAPDFTTTPPSESASSEAVFEFTIEADAVAQCSVDVEAFESCASPLNLTALEEGSRSFSVRAVDAAGNIGSTSTYTWNISFETNQCRPEVTESAPLELPDEAGMEDGGEE